VIQYMPLVSIHEA